MNQRYGVIICPFCASPLGADLRKRTMTCTCGKTIDLIKVKPRFVSSSPVEVAQAVAIAKSQIARGKMDKPSSRRSRSRIGKLAERAQTIKDAHERLTYIAKELTRQKKEFTLNDLERVHELIGRESANDMLVVMKESGIVYESGKGKFRAV